jgi:hypothetical protein
LTQALAFHVDLAAAAGVKTEFRLLNSSPPIEVSIDHPEVNEYFSQSPMLEEK